MEAIYERDDRINLEHVGKAICVFGSARRESRQEVL